MKPISRRKLLIGTSAGAGGAVLVSCDSLPSIISSVPEEQQLNLTILSDIAFLQFPHTAAENDLYQQIATIALDSPDVINGLSALRSSLSKSWNDHSYNEKVEVLTTLEGSALFSVVKATTINVLYGDPDFFALIGYGGSAIEQGGYINRGFDDIDWLPAEGGQ
jgi:hypothetical protein